MRVIAYVRGYAPDAPHVRHVGYDSSLLPIVFELHNQFIDQALDLMDQTADLPDDARFRWTCESADLVWQWWQQAEVVN